MNKNRLDLNAVALVSGILTGAWGLLWLILCLVYKGEQLNMINSIHPWKIWVAVLVLAFIVHRVALWIKPDMRFRGVQLSKLKLQAQLLLLVLAIDVTWSALVEIKFYWTLEMGVLAVMELILVMDKNSKGFSGSGVSPITVVTLAGTGLIALLISVFIEPIGNALLFVSLKLKWLMGTVLKGISGVIVFVFTHLKMKAPVTITEDYEQRADYAEEVFDSPNDNAFTFFKYLIYVMLGLIVLLCIAALVMVLIDRIKKLWEYRRETVSASASNGGKTGFFESIAITVKMLVKRVKAIALLRRNRNSVGYALYELEKKYKTDKKLRRQKGETPAAFIDKIIEAKQQKMDESVSAEKQDNRDYFKDIGMVGGSAADQNSMGAASLTANIEELAKLEMIKNYATRAAYDRDFSWLTELP